MAISKSLGYIASSARFALTKADPWFALTTRSHPIQRIILYKCLEDGATYSLNDLARDCTAGKYESTYERAIAPADASIFLRRSVLYHLERMARRGLVKEIA